MKSKCLLASLPLLACLFCASFAQAASRHYYVDALFGFGLTKTRGSQIVQVRGFADQVYKTDSDHSLFFDMGLRSGFIISMSQRWSLQLGGGYYANTRYGLDGSYYQTPVEPPDLTYKVDLYTQRLMLEAQLTYNMTQHYALYLGGGFGGVKTRTQGLAFESIIYSGGAAVPLPAHNYTHYQFAGAVSLGTLIQLSRICFLKIGLSYLRLGNIIFSVNQGMTGAGTYSRVKVGALAPLMLTVGFGFQF